MIGPRYRWLACLLLALFAACNGEPDVPDGSSAVSEEWTTASATYEGFPLYVRAPTEIDYSRAADFPTLVIVTLNFAETQTSGLPEPEYNHELFEFDQEVVALFEDGDRGFTVLVETFAGKRHFYHYASDDAPVQDLFDGLQRRYPEYDLELEFRSDPDWSFRKKYSEEYGF